MMLARREFGWFGTMFMFVLGVFLLFITYKLYENAALEDQIAIRSPVVCMKIVAREKGLGTLKFPDKIYGEYKFRTYRFDLGRKSFRSLIGVDSIAVSLDSVSGKAVLPSSGRVRHLAVLFVGIVFVGILVIWGSVQQAIKLLNGALLNNENE